LIYLLFEFLNRVAGEHLNLVVLHRTTTYKAGKPFQIRTLPPGAECRLWTLSTLPAHAPRIDARTETE
jgi:hypothetical protein